ncbi:glutaredoxin domain-containing cysteine-rich protein 2 [Rhinophrynus dorsalis]
MEELQRKLSQRYEERPRKVRFKISSAYSGRVLKQVFEDGHELESPEEEYPHSFLNDSFESSEHHYSREESPPRYYPATRLTAKRISVFRDGNSYTLAGDPLFSNCRESDKPTSEVIDFGKIIIYTNNLKIIRTPMDKREISENEKCLHKGGRLLGEKEQGFSSGDQYKNPQSYKKSITYVLQEDNEIHQCSQCGGSRCAPCSLCHGSKFSMLANRFKESYRSLRCPACDENGLEPCQTCSH